MANYDGDNFRALDEEAYAPDRPMSTGLDHGVRNALMYLARQGAQCSYSERLDADGAPAKVYSGHPSTYRGPWLLHVSPGCGGIEASFPASAGPSGAGEEGDVWVAVKSARLGKVEGTKVSITNTTDVVDYRTYTASVDFPETSEPEFILVSLMFQSADYATADSGVTLGRSPGTGILYSGDPYSRSQMGATSGAAVKAEIVYDEIGIVGSQPGGPNPPYTIDEAFIRDLTWIAGPGVELREKRDTFEGYDSSLIRAHDSTRGAAIVPRYDRGGGANLGLSEQVFNRWYTASIGTQYGDKPNSDWDNFQRWTYVGSSDVARSVPFQALNDRVRLAFAVPIIGYSTAIEDSTTSSERIVATEADITITLELSDFSGSTVATVSGTVPVSFYKRDESGASVFFAQMYVRSNVISPAPRWTWREGQLFDLEGGLDERDLITPVAASDDVVDLVAGSTYRARWTFGGTSDADLEYVVVGQPTIQQLVTPASEG